MKRVFVDSGAWYALVDKNEPERKRAKKFFAENTLCTSFAVMKRLKMDMAF